MLLLPAPPPQTPPPPLLLYLPPPLLLRALLLPPPLLLPHVPLLYRLVLRGGRAYTPAHVSPPSSAPDPRALPLPARALPAPPPDAPLADTSGCLGSELLLLGCEGGSRRPGILLGTRNLGDNRLLPVCVMLLLLLLRNLGLSRLLPPPPPAALLLLLLVMLLVAVGLGGFAEGASEVLCRLKIGDDQSGPLGDLLLTPLPPSCAGAAAAPAAAAAAEDVPPPAAAGVAAAAGVPSSPMLLELRRRCSSATRLPRGVVFFSAALPPLGVVLGSSPARGVRPPAGFFAAVLLLLPLVPPRVVAQDGVALCWLLSAAACGEGMQRPEGTTPGAPGMLLLSLLSFPLGVTCSGSLSRGLVTALLLAAAVSAAPLLLLFLRLSPPTCCWSAAARDMSEWIWADSSATFWSKDEP